MAVIGSSIRRNLFGSEDAIGKHLKVNDIWFEVIGVLEESGGNSSFQGVAVGATSTEIYVPASTAIRKFDRPPLEAPLDEIVVRLGEDVSPQATAVASTLLERVHGGATTSTSWYPRRCWSKAAAPSGCSTSSWAASPASRCWSAASAS